MSMRQCFLLNSGCADDRLLATFMCSIEMFGIACFSIWVSLLVLHRRCSCVTGAYLKRHNRAAEACELADTTRKLGVEYSTFL